MGRSELLFEQPDVELYHNVSTTHHKGNVVGDQKTDTVRSCINSRSKRFSNIKDIQNHPYFAEVDWEILRETKAPFVPELDSETDAGYFDDFSNEADMAKYKEVHDKQQALEGMADRDDEMSKSLFVGFTFRHRKPANEDGSSPRKKIPFEEDAAPSFGTML